MLNWPNRISALRVLLVVPFLALFFSISPDREWARYFAMAVFLLTALSDGLDGYLARRLNQQTDLGRLLDPLGDKLLIVAAVVALGWRGVPTGPDPASLLRLPAWVVVAVIAKDVILLIGLVVLMTNDRRGAVRPRRVGKWCTGVQFAMVMAMLAARDLPGVLSGLPRFTWWLATALAVLAAADYARFGYHALKSVPESATSK